MTRCGLVSLANSLPQFPMLEAEKPVVVVVTARASPLDFADRDSAGKRVFVCVCVCLCVFVGFVRPVDQVAGVFWCPKRCSMLKLSVGSPAFKTDDGIRLIPYVAAPH